MAKNRSFPHTSCRPFLRQAGGLFPPISTWKRIHSCCGKSPSHHHHITSYIMNTRSSMVFHGRSTRVRPLLMSPRPSRLSSKALPRTQRVGPGTARGHLPRQLLLSRLRQQRRDGAPGRGRSSRRPPTAFRCFQIGWRMSVMVMVWRHRGGGVRWRHLGPRVPL